MTGLRECRPGGSCPQCNPPPVYCQSCLEVEVEDENEPCAACSAAAEEERVMDEKRIEELRARVAATEIVAREAGIVLAEAEADLADAMGDADLARFKRLYAEAQKSRTHEAHDAFMACAREREAKWQAELKSESPQQPAA